MNTLHTIILTDVEYAQLKEFAERAEREGQWTVSEARALKAMLSEDRQFVSRSAESEVKT